MTASRTGLAILAAIAVALAIAHAVIGPPPPPPSRATFAGIPEPASLAWERPGQPPVVVARATGAACGGAASCWAMRAPWSGPVDAAVVADVVAAVRGARWQRRASAMPGSPRLIVRLDALRLAIGAEVPGVGTWIGDGGGAYLVDTWVATALDRPPLALRVGGAVAIPVARAVALGVRAEGVDLALAGSPLAVTTPDGPVRVRPEPIAALGDAIAALRAQALVADDAPRPAPRGELAIADDARAERVELLGACPGAAAAVWLRSSTAGDLCVPEAAWAQLVAAAALVAAQPLAVADPRPASAPVSDVVLAGGAHLRWRGATAEVEVAPGRWELADDDAVAPIARALFGEAPVVLLGGRRAPPRAAIAVAGPAGRDLLEVIDDQTLARAGTPVGFRVGPAAIAALATPSGALGDRLLWRTEPALLTALTVQDGAGPSRPVDVATAWAAELAQALAAPRAVRLGAAPAAGRRVIELSYAPPPAAGATPEIHRLVLGPGVAGGCAATADGRGVVLPRALCAVLEKPPPR